MSGIFEIKMSAFNALRFLIAVNSILINALEYTTIYSNGNDIDLSNINFNIYERNVSIVALNNFPKNISNTNNSVNRFTQRIVLSNNSIRYIDKFAFVNFQKLIKLDLGKNQLKMFDNVFSSSLRELHLAENEINEISDESIENLDLIVISLNFNKIQVIRNSTFKFKWNMGYLYLFKNLIHTIENNSFEYLYNLKHLYLYANKLTKIDKNIFKNLFSLEKLYIYENEITEIESGSFLNMGVLRELYLNSNKIKFLSNSSFLGLNWVEKIWLQKNELKELGLVFGNLFNLQNIVLDHNNLEKIDAEIFKHNKNLKTIELCSNDFSKINSLIINNLTNLISIRLHNNSNLREISVLENSWVEILTLDNNKLTEIGRNLKLANLKSLYLINNLILTLKNSSFAYLKELQYLDLQSNRIITIEKNSFKSLSKLKTLILKNNYLDGSYSDYFIEDLTNMETIDLSYNQYQYFGKDFFRNLKKLKELKINNNLLKQIDSDLFQHNNELKSVCLNENKLKNITLNSSKLIRLDINSNFITEIKDEYFNLPNLEKIDCANNLIESIHFNNTFRLSSIDLSNNKFTVLNPSFFSHYKYMNLTILKMNGTYTFSAEISDLENLVEIDLSFNTILSSNFTLKYHKKLQKVKFRQMKNFTTFNLLINPNLKEIDFSQNSLINQFSIFDSLEKVEVLELSQVGLTEIVELKLELFHDLSKLDLSYNFLTYLNESTFTRMPKLTYLDLSFNRIKHLDVNIFKWLRTLIYLDMKNNQISFICDEFLNYLDIANLKLAHNQLKKLPKFKINIETDRPISLSELSLENNLFSHIEQFPMGIGQLKSLKLDSNNISSIEHEAFFFLSNLKKLSISNNSIGKIFVNLFYGMISIESLNLSTNKIAYIEENTFQNLNKLLVLDLSQNYIKSIDANVFYGLTSLKDLFLKDMLFEINDQSFNYLNNLSNIHMAESIIKENECLVMRLFKREMVKKSFLHENEFILANRSVFRLYYRSINILTSESSVDRECDLKLFFLQFNIHLDLKTDFKMENFYFQCGKNLINQKNYYSANELKCFIPTFNKSSQDSISFFIKINFFILHFCISVLKVYF